MAFTATGASSLDLSRRNCAPRYGSLSRRVLAAILRATVSRLVVGNRPFPIIFSPLIRLSGHRRSQETKWCSSSHLLMSQPTSLITVTAVRTSIPASLRSTLAKDSAPKRPKALAVGWIGRQGRKGAAMDAKSSWLRIKVLVDYRLILAVLAVVALVVVLLLKK